MATEKQQDNWIKEGRGQGYLKNYKPWVTVRDFGSKGRSHRVYGHTTKRTHHLLSAYKNLPSTLSFYSTVTLFAKLRG